MAISLGADSRCGTRCSRLVYRGQMLTRVSLAAATEKCCCPQLKVSPVGTGGGGGGFCHFLDLQDISCPL